MVRMMCEYFGQEYRDYMRQTGQPELQEAHLTPSSKKLAVMRYGADLLIVLEDKLTAAGNVECQGEIWIAQLVSGDRQCAIFDLVDRISLLADLLGRRAFSDDADELFRIGILPECECSLHPIVGISAVELQGLARDG